LQRPSKIGGDEGDRTPDLGIANAALSQLSYIPDRFIISIQFDLRQMVLKYEDVQPESIILPVDQPLRTRAA
jgi:hypothetical protein